MTAQTAIPESRRLDFSEVPIIDLAALVRGCDDQASISQLEVACRDVGFVYVVNHGVSARLVHALAHEARNYFSFSEDNKNEHLVDTTMRGYLPLLYRSYEGEDRAGTSHQEGFWIGHDRAPSARVPLDCHNRWPEFAPTLRPAMEAYFTAVETLSRTLMRGFALALGLPPDALQRLFSQPLSRLKLNHYPPQYDIVDEHHIGVVPHSDSGGFTILWQDENGGLEVQSKSGDWVVAPPVEDAFVINLGNVMQVWTDGYFASTPHRVINRAAVDRYSIPLFVNPSHDALVSALPAFAQPEDAHGSMSYGDYQLDIWRRTFPIAYAQ